MKAIQLTQGKVALIDDADFEQVSKFKWFAHRMRRRFYADRRLRKPDGTWGHQLMHRFLVPGMNSVRQNLPWPGQRLILAALLLFLAAPCFAISDVEAEALASSIFLAEGGEKAKVAYGILSVKVRSREHAREICLRTIRANWRRWSAAGCPGEYLEFLAKRYAPLNASNDPQRLNRHWLRNVRSRLSETRTDRYLLARRRIFSID